MDDNYSQAKGNGDQHSITRLALVWHQDYDHPMGAWINGHYYILADNNPQTINRSEDRRSEDHVRIV